MSFKFLLYKLDLVWDSTQVISSKTGFGILDEEAEELSYWRNGVVLLLKMKS